MTRINAVYAGMPVPFGPGDRKSAIAKKSVAGPVHVTRTGLSKDAHGDIVHHGGIEQAVHHYAREHYGRWHSAYPASRDRFQIPFFGENISTSGMTEATVCVGDVYTVGTVTLQVSQARQPCWKLSVRSGIDDFSRRVQESGLTGWFYRVLVPGNFSAGDEMRLAQRPHPRWTLERLLTLMYRTPLLTSELEEMAELPSLSPGWKNIARRRLETQKVEAWEARLSVPRS